MWAPPLQRAWEPEVWGEEERMSLGIAMGGGVGVGGGRGEWVEGWGWVRWGAGRGAGYA